MAIDFFGKPFGQIPTSYEEGLNQGQIAAINTQQNMAQVYHDIMNLPPDNFNSQMSQQNMARQLAAAQAQQHAVRVDLHKNAYSMLMSRLHGVAGSFIMGANDYLFTHVHTDRVFVFFVHNDRAGHLEDDINIFPSDKLITQVRLLWS